MDVIIIKVLLIKLTSIRDTEKASEHSLKWHISSEEITTETEWQQRELSLLLYHSGCESLDSVGPFTEQ